MAPSPRQGLVEYLVVLLLLALAAAGALTYCRAPLARLFAPPPQQPARHAPPPGPR